ncbi:carboxylesterase family protein [Streptomyces sp. ODS28]|uniref:carboxylesterase/lipase family protein n=1 Tax=Streptomyces sp. ODS28 TaxID=3136688 RepID=UPI0031EA6B5A
MTRVELKQGGLRGSEREGVHAFLGIPYAAPPVGAARFAAPGPAPTWSGERDATRYGPTAPQPEGRMPGVDFSAIGGPGWVRGEESLTVNVWTPDPGAAGLPVLVFLHGGAFVSGSGSGAGYDGTRFAQDGVVLVTLNYRVGVAGYASLEGAPDNRGLLDQIAALHWVRENIAAFGGDPERVTVSGESAGGMSVAALLAAAPAGLFRRAVSQSGGGCASVTRAQAASASRQLAELLGARPSAESFARFSDGELVGALSELLLRRPGLAVDGARHPLMGLTPLSTVIDGELLTGQAAEMVAASSASGVDLLLGSNAEEFNFYTVGLGISVPDAELPSAAAPLHPDPDAVAAAYRAAGRGDPYSALGTDYVFAVPTKRLADAHAPHGAGTWRYEFAWSSPGFDGRLGACHGLELPFVFDNVGRVDYGDLGIPDDDPTRELSRRTHRAWVDFATTGDPGWPQYAVDRPTVQRIGTTWTTTELADGPERALWDGVL